MTVFGIPNCERGSEAGFCEKPGFWRYPPRLSTSQRLWKRAEHLSSAVHSVTCDPTSSQLNFPPMLIAEGRDHKLGWSHS